MQFCNETPFKRGFRYSLYLISQHKFSTLFIKTPSYGGFRYRECQWNP